MNKRRKKKATQKRQEQFERLTLAKLRKAARFGQLYGMQSPVSEDLSRLFNRPGKGLKEFAAEYFRQFPHVKEMQDVPLIPVNYEALERQVLARRGVK